MAEVTKVRTRKSPNGNASGSPVAARVDELCAQAQTDPAGARDVAWDWIAELGRRARGDRAGALDELQQLFESGQPATGIDGQTEGILVTWTMNPAADKAIGTITNAWMPWLGKKFYAEKDRGENTLTGSARWPAKLLWPLYRMSDSPLGRTAFGFETYVEAGKLDPGVEVLVIDYARVNDNPRLLIRQIRDELVQVVPGANLGKMLVAVPGRSELLAACYFALRSDL
ncbi:MAG TPA: hypothetical protein VGI87_02210 [Solirubrobacteraceae bacterium]|jgi:hypothetical protein